MSRFRFTTIAAVIGGVCLAGAVAHAVSGRARASAWATDPERGPGPARPSGPARASASADTSGRARASAPADVSSRARASARATVPISLPLWFEPVGSLPGASEGDAKAGGAPERATRFVARRSAFEMVVDGRGAQVRLSGAARATGVGSSALATQGSPELSRRPKPARYLDGGHRNAPTYTLAIQFLAANDDVTPRAERPLPGVSHYYLGNDPAKWRTNVPQFGAVRLPALYDGVDVVFYGTPAALEYDVVVAPGANPAPVRFRLDGADAVSAAEDGGLVAEIAGRHVFQHAPIAYQEIDGARVRVDARYRVGGSDGEIGFEVGDYDRSHPLVIDPVVIVYGTLLGGSDEEFGSAPDILSGGIVADATGNVYVVGDTMSTDMPGFGASPGATPNVFVAKLNPAGSALAFATYIGGTNGDEGGSIALDAAGSVWVAGQTVSLDLPRPRLTGLIQPGYNGTADVFVARLTATGTLDYLSYLGGSSEDFVEGIATWGTASTVRVALVGETLSTSNFPITANAQQPLHASPSLADAWVVVLEPKAPALGTWLNYGSYFGGSGIDYGLGVAVDRLGRVVISGQTFSSIFPTTTGAFQTSLVGGGPDAFVTRFNTGSTWSLDYSTYFGGAGADSAKVAVGPDSAIYLGGTTTSTLLPGAVGSSPAQPTNKGGTEGFVAKLLPAAVGPAQLVYRTYLGGAGRDVVMAVFVDDSSRAYATGYTLSTSATFPVVDPLTGHTNNGGKEDAFLTRVNPAGSAFELSTYLGGAERDLGLGVTVAPGFGTFVFGLTETASPFTLQSQGGGTAIDSTLGGTRDAFVARIVETSPAPPFISTVAPATGPSAGGTTITLTGSGFVTGAGVSVGGAPAPTVAVVSATTITAVTPAGTAGVARDVDVTNPDGQSFTKSAAFTYVGAPTVTSLTPGTGPTSGGTFVSIAGTNFVNGATLSIGGSAPVSTTFVNSSALTANTPAGTAGARDVVVTNPDGQSATLANGFTYTSAVASITSIAPNSGPAAGGTAVTIAGTNLQGPVTVTIGGASAVVGSVTPTAITATTPAGTAGARDVVVTTGGQTLTLANAFLYFDGQQPAPTLASIAPNRGSVIGGQPVTLFGTNFVTGATVKFGVNAATSVTVVNTTRITAITPANSAGTFNVVVTNLDGKANAEAVGYTFEPDSDGDGMGDSWEQQYGSCGLNPASNLDASRDPDTDGATNLQEFIDDTDPCNAVLRYFAEGATIAPFTTRFALMNDDATRTAQVTLQFLTDAGDTIATSRVIPPQSRITVLPKTEVTGMDAAQFSTVVKSNLPLAADRTMTWDDSVYGAHAETAILAPAAQWYLAEGATIGTFNLFYLLQNPNDADAQVTVRYLLSSGAPVQKVYTVAKRSRQNIWVNFETVEGVSLNGQELSAEFTTDASTPIIVERAMYAEVPNQQFGAGHEAAAVTAPATDWYLAEGATGFFNLFILVANANDTPADVEVTYLLPGGRTVARSYTFGPNSRSNIWVNQDAELANTAVSAVLRSDVPVIVERAMWWGEGLAWYEAHDSPGVTATATKWILAEGEVGETGALDTYILIANTSDRSGTARVTLVFEGGAPPLVKDVTLDAASRTNLWVGSPDIGDSLPAGTRFGAVVEALGSQPIQLVVERAMYWSTATQVYAAGTNSVATPISR